MAGKVEKVRILFCNCSYAKVVPKETKKAVLKGLCQSGKAFDAVADLCEMSARNDPSLKHLARGKVKIAACFPRAVQWLFSAADAPLDLTNTEVINMRNASEKDASDALMRSDLKPNLPRSNSSDSNSSDSNSSDSNSSDSNSDSANSDSDLQRSSLPIVKKKI